MDRGYPAVSNQGITPLQWAGCRWSFCKEARTRKGWTCLNLDGPVFHGCFHSKITPPNIPFFDGFPMLVKVQSISSNQVHDSTHSLLETSTMQTLKNNDNFQYQCSRSIHTICSTWKTQCTIVKQLRHISKVDGNILVPLLFSRRENPGAPTGSNGSLRLRRGVATSKKLLRHLWQFDRSWVVSIQQRYSKTSWPLVGNESLDSNVKVDFLIPYVSGQPDYQMPPLPNPSTEESLTDRRMASGGT